MAGDVVSRRCFLSAGAVLGPNAILGNDLVSAESYSGKIPWKPGTASVPEPVEPGSLQFFTPAEASFVDAALARLIPNDEFGPGANEALVTISLARQLAGAYQRAETCYMQGHWKDGDDTHVVSA